MSGTANKAKIVAALGASGSGKSEWVKRTFLSKTPPRLMVWSPLEVSDNYGRWGQVITDDAVALVHAANASAFRLVFVPSDDPTRRAAQFRTFCKLAFAVGNCTVIVEELRFVTLPSRAPSEWAALTLQGRHRGLTVIGTSQRPASIDKDFLGNCTVIHTGALVYPEDVKAVASAMRIAPSEIDALQDLEFIETTRSPRSKKTGKLRF